MPHKKGIAIKKKAEKYIFIDSDGEEISPPGTPTIKPAHDKKPNPLQHKKTPPKQSPKADSPLADFDEEDADPTNPRGLPKLSNPLQPCQGSKSSHSDQLQQSTLADSLFPSNEDKRAEPQVESLALTKVREAPRPLSHPREPSCHGLHPSDAHPKRRIAAKSTRLPRLPACTDSDPVTSSRATRPPSDPPIYQPITDSMANMIPGGAFVPPNQQRNLRACMVCSIVRTYTQFMNGGCPNCEEFLELTGNSENVNDCTSQVFEGLITVADTSKSWVARYQRLEGYVPGVYATQVEGILPEEIVSSIEAAGINYVPRDGSEDQMIPKD